MPSANHETTLARQWELLKLLPSNPPGKTSRELRDRLEGSGHEVTKRTVERDLAELSRVFPIVSNEISKPYGWHWRPGARVDLPGIDLAEAVSLGLLEDLLRQLIPPTFMDALEGRFAEAREKLTALPQNRYAKWADLIRYVPPGMPLQKPLISPEVLRTVQDALLRQRRLKVTHCGPGATVTKELLLHPLALIQQGERSYLVATAFDYGNVLYYALHRIRTAEVTDEPAERPASFTLDAFLAEGGGQFGDGTSISLKANLTDNMAAILRETAISPDQIITTRGGRNTLTATVKNSWQLHFWILSLGPFITVLQPVSLRKHMITKLTDALSNYAPTKPAAL
jgi:predicted DNA-binding transcriptional regulator YafY